MDSNPVALDSTSPSFRKPANEVSRRNYRRHSPTTSSHSQSPPSPGPGKRDRSPRAADSDSGGPKREKRLDSDGDLGKSDRRKETDVVQRNCGGLDSEGDFRRRKETDADYRNRARHGRCDDYDHNRNRRHGYNDHGYRDSHWYDDGRYSRRSPERLATRHRDDAESRHRRKESRSERDKDRDEKSDVPDRLGYKEREAHSGRSKSGSKRMEPVLDMDRRDWNSEDKSKVDGDRPKDREYRRRDKDDGAAKECEKDGDNYHQCKGSEYGDHWEKNRKKSAHHTDSSKDETYFSSSHEVVSEKSKERTKHGHGDKDRKYSNDSVKLSSDDTARAPATIACNYVDDSKKLAQNMDDKSSKVTKWGPESVDAPASADPEAAKLAAIKAAQQVSINLGNFKSVDEKKKMLWRSKAQEPAASSGTIRWDTVQFADCERREKFKKLMGVKGDAAENVPETRKNASGNVFTTEKQQELQQDLEKQFTAGLRRRDGRTVGLGL